MLTLPAPCISESCIEMKIELNLYFHTSIFTLSLRLGLGREGLNHSINVKSCDVIMGIHANGRKQCIS